MKRLWGGLLTASLWLVGIGLMLASSGIDGAYMARWMTDLPGIGGAALLGYVLNTTADVASMTLTYWFGRLQMDASTTKRRRSAAILAAEAVAVVFSWFFSWRQLRIVLPPTEGADAAWVAPIAAGFIPLLLAFIGYTQALIAGRIERAEAPQTSQAHAEPDRPIPTSAHRCAQCGRIFATQQALAAHSRAHAPREEGA